MNIKDAKKLALNPQAFAAGDRYIVFDTTKRPIEGAGTLNRATSQMVALNEHEERNGRLTRYYVEPITE